MKTFLLALIFSIFLINSNILFLFFDTKFVFTQFQKQGVYKHFNSTEIPNLKYKEIISFLLGRQTLSGFFNVRESLHLSDAKDIFQNMTKLEAALILVLIIMSLRVDRSIIIKAILVGSILNFVLIALNLLALLNFGYFFDNIFHPLLFKNDYWQLEENSNLLHLTPYGFYLEAYKILLFRIFLISTGIILIGKLYLWKQSKNK